MKATKLIRALAEAIENHGDMDIHCRDLAGDFEDIFGVRFIGTAGVFYIVIDQSDRDTFYA